jgi:hypothetical protein
MQSGAADIQSAERENLGVLTSVTPTPKKGRMSFQIIFV